MYFLTLCCRCYEESRAKALAQLALGGGSETTHKAGTPV